MATRGSLSHGERGGVRATKHTIVQIVARFGPLSDSSCRSTAVTGKMPALLLLLSDYS